MAPVAGRGDDRLVGSHMDAIAQLDSALANRYAIDREIGRGGMATVYLARDLKHHRPVAFKVLDPELGAVLEKNVLGFERFDFLRAST